MRFMLSFFVAFNCRFYLIITFGKPQAYIADLVVAIMFSSGLAKFIGKMIYFGTHNNKIHTI
jgi:hypothetical protein